MSAQVLDAASNLKSMLRPEMTEMATMTSPRTSEISCRSEQPNVGTHQSGADLKHILRGFDRGAIVEVRGLETATHLNGKRGVVNGRVQEGRPGVHFPLPDGDKALWVKNLVLIAEASDHILSDQDELRGEVRMTSGGINAQDFTKRLDLMKQNA